MQKDVPILHLVIIGKVRMIKMSEALKRAKVKYQSKVKRFTTDFYPTESDLWEHLQNQPQKQTYINNLIREDMKKEQA